MPESGSTFAAPPETTGALPKYIQISEMLIRRMAAGQLPEGTRLPPERELAQSLGISVGTLRKSLADLEEKGLLERIQGSGNYVRHRPDVPSVYAFFRIERVEGGGLPTARVLSVDRLPKPESAPPFGSGPDAHRIRRLRSLEGEVIALEEIWLDGAQAPQVSPAMLSESLYHFYRQSLGLTIMRVEDRIGVRAVPDWVHPAFPVSAGTPVGFIERVSWDQVGRAVEYSRTWFDTEKARYVSRMGKV